MKKFIVSTIFTTILFALWYYLITLYDTNNVILPRVMNNKYYVLFLYISIVAWFGLYREDNSKSKLFVFFIFLINFLYLCSIFLIWNIWLTKIQCLIFVWLLLIGFLATLLRNWIGYIIIILSLIWELLLIYVSIIPLYENWPDIEWFNEQFETKFVIYSNVGINKDKASIQKDNKELEILDGTNEYNFSIRQWWSEILFKSDNAYKNSYWFLLFKWWEFVEITPQSAIKINEDYEIEVLWWNIKYYPQNPTQFKITWTSNNTQKSNKKEKSKTWDIQIATWDIQENSWDVQEDAWNVEENTWDNQINTWDILIWWDEEIWEPETLDEDEEEVETNETNEINETNIQVESDEEVINITKWIYNKKLKYYIKQQIWWNLQLDIRILKLSKNTLELLKKINPKYQNNLDNLQAFLDIFEINLDEYDFRQDIKFWETTKDIINTLSDAIDSVK